MVSPTHQVFAVSLRGRDNGGTAEITEGANPALRASQGGGDKPHILVNWQIRRLTPTECERLQGFSGSYTAIPGFSDSQRYRAIGNSMAVPCMAWIGRRIAFVDTIPIEAGPV
jgi:DNA (cytosine-5)-methyltransferase 1